MWSGKSTQAPTATGSIRMRVRCGPGEDATAGSGESAMFTRQQPAVEAFLAAHRGDLVQMILVAYATVGGHYAALAEEARATQAVSDAREFTATLSSGQIDHAAIGRVVATAEGRARIPDIVQMTRVLEARFNALVA